MHPENRLGETTMSRRVGWISLVIAALGLGACLMALVGFFRTILTNDLPFHPELTAREHYLAVGRAYSSGFLTGFFLCFFLVVAVLAVSAVMAVRSMPRLVRDRRWARPPVPFPGESA